MGIRLSTLHLGSILIDENLIVCNSNVATVNEPRRENSRILIPVQAFLLQTEDRNILFDTGCNTNAMGKGGRWPEKYQNQVFHERSEDQTITAQLQRFHLTPKDIDCVILSHMHNDHAGNLELFTEAEIYVHREEFHACLEAYATYDIMSSYIWKDTDCWLKKQWKWNFIEDGEPDFDLEKGIRIINLGPGHTRGNLALLVSLEHYGKVILTADAIYCGRNINPGLNAPGVVYDTVGWRRSATRLLRIAGETGASLWLGHDMEQYQMLSQRETYN